VKPTVTLEVYQLFNPSVPALTAAEMVGLVVSTVKEPPEDSKPVFPALSTALTKKVYMPWTRLVMNEAELLPVEVEATTVSPDIL
jgi:hypothetical protein